MLLALLWAAALGVTPAPPRFDASGRSIGSPLSERTASYVLEARLDPATRKLAGRATLTWVNRSHVPQRLLWFHAYWNAFKNARSTFAREAKARGSNRSGVEDFGDQDWGWTELRTARLPDGTDLRPSLAWERPDDGNPDDQTVFTLTLPTPVAPGASLTLELTWEARVPKLVARTGVHGGFFLLGQWFPKVGVLDVPPQRGVTAPLWNCHQFHASTEFYADFGSYDASLTVPRSMVVGATGVRTGRTENPDGTVTHRFHQDDVIDFAWTAWNGFTEVHDVFRSEGLPEVTLNALVSRGSEAVARQLLEASRSTLEYGGRHWSPYPFPQLTIVAPPAGTNLRAGGMEYPTFVTGYLRAEPEQPRDMFLWEVAAHELGHNWFQGMLASNEFEEAWLDEGIDTWAVATFLEEQHLPWDLALLGPPGLRGALRPFLRSSLPDSEVHGRGRLPRFQSPIARPGWRFRTVGEVGATTYDRSALTLRLLERTVGPETFSRIIRTYAERWAFRHPGTDDFFAVASEVAGRDLRPLANQLLRGTAGLDDAVADVRCTPSDDRAGPGLFDEGGGLRLRPRSPPTTEVDAHRRWRCEVLVERRGDLALPADVRVRFEDGSTVTEHWAPGEVWRRFEYQRLRSEGGQVVEARVHPDGPVPLDADPVNDARSRTATVAPVAQLTGWFLYTAQLLVAALGSLL